MTRKDYSVRVLTPEEIAALDAPLTMWVDTVTEDDLKSQEDFRQLVLGALANSLTAVARIHLTDRYNLSYQDAQDAAAEVLARLATPGSYLTKAWRNAKNGALAARKRGIRPRHLIVAYLYRTVRDVCSDQQRRKVHSLPVPMDDVDPAIVSDPSDAAPDVIEGLMGYLSTPNLSSQELFIVICRVRDEWTYLRIAQYFEADGESALSRDYEVHRRYEQICKRLRKCLSDGG
jgi:hypothetical protein